MATISSTEKHLAELLETLSHDLSKAIEGNKAAAQRVRTGTIQLEKVAKVFRKESVAAEKSGKVRRVVKRASGSAAAARSHGAGAKAKPKAKSAPVATKAKPKGKTVAKKATSASTKGSARPAARQKSTKRATAKLPGARAKM